MPANTPIYGFTYPCLGEPVNAASFSTLANQIDTKMASLAVDENWALGRYSVWQVPAAQAGIASGVDTVLVNPGASYVIPADGVYIATAEYQGLATTNIDSIRLRLRLNGVAVPGQTLNNDPAAISTQDVSLPGIPFVCVAGDTISATVLFFGVGTLTIFFELTVRMLVRTL